MPFIILKKTFKTKATGYEKSFSLHGGWANASLASNLNQALARIKYTNRANKLQFTVNSAGHFYAVMNHDCQKYHEEDAICVILDVMEVMGWTFQRQWDTSMTSSGSATSREMFLFQQRS